MEQAAVFRRKQEDEAVDEAKELSKEIRQG